MKALSFILGVALGLVLADIVLRPPDARGIVHAQPTPNANTVSARAPASAASRAAASTGASALSPTPQPANTGRPPFFFGSLVRAGLDTSKLSAADAADPEFQALYARALRGRATDMLAPVKFALELNDTQFAALLDVACEQALAWNPASDRGLSREARNARWREASLDAEKRLATALSPTQLERLARSGVLPARGPVIYADNFASRGAALSAEQIRSLLNTGRTDPSFFTDAERQSRARQQRWSEADGFVRALKNARVKDPDLKEMWPLD